MPTVNRSSLIVLVHSFSTCMVFLTESRMGLRSGDPFRFPMGKALATTNAGMRATVDGPDHHQIDHSRCPSSPLPSTPVPWRGGFVIRLSLAGSTHGQLQPAVRIADGMDAEEGRTDGERWDGFLFASNIDVIASPDQTS